jgi:nucleotide-binding universal stress UspA family protein
MRMGRLALSPAAACPDDGPNRMRDTTMTVIEKTGSAIEADGASRKVRHVLLATDLSDASRRATDRAITLAARDHAVLQILSVAPKHVTGAEVEQRIGAVRRRARALGIVATSVVWHGDPAEAILEAAWTERPDVLVLGARHHRWLARLEGSVSGKVAAEAPCQVEIVPG